jgi:tetratricopeptide (TPR) repeat protein
LRIEGEALRRAAVDSTFNSQQREQMTRRVYPLLAEAYAHLDRVAEADSLLKEIPAAAIDGWRARGRVATLRLDYATADAAFREAVQRAPSIPAAYDDWADMLAIKGDLIGAIAKYAEANRRGPHFADALKGWGDVLVKQGTTKDALVKYDEALKFAPNWKQLKDAREAAAKQKS